MYLHGTFFLVPFPPNNTNKQCTVPPPFASIRLSSSNCTPQHNGGSSLHWLCAVSHILPCLDNSTSHSFSSPITTPILGQMCYRAFAVSLFKLKHPFAFHLSIVALTPSAHHSFLAIPFPRNSQSGSAVHYRAVRIYGTARQWHGNARYHMVNARQCTVPLLLVIFLCHPLVATYCRCCQSTWNKFVMNKRDCYSENVLEALTTCIFGIILQLGLEY